MIISTNKILSDLECEFIKNYILTNEERIKKLGPDIYSGTHDDSLTGRFPYFNYLSDPEIGDIFFPKLMPIFKAMNLKLPIAVQCWGNTFRKNQGIEYHKHARNDGRDFISGNIFISGPTLPGTTYDINGQLLDIENEPGILTLFSAKVGHMVKPNPSDEIRISMAIDIIEDCVEYMNWIANVGTNLDRYLIIKSIKNFDKTE